MNTPTASPDLDTLITKTREFIRTVVVPAEPGPGETLSSELQKQLSEKAKAAGVYAPQVPTELGGLGLPFSDWSAVFQEIGYSPIGPSVLNCMAPDEGNIHMLNLLATPAQREQYLKPLASGAIRSCFGMTEPHPGAGSDPAALQTEALRDGDDWVITGEKRFTSGAELAQFCIVMARTPEDGEASATMFLVDMDAPGVRVGAPINTIDHTIPGGHPYVHFDGVRVSGDAILGQLGAGFQHSQARLGPARLTHCMRWLGLARRSLDIALDRANTRELFGSPLAGLGVAQDMVASAVIDIETSDAIITKTAVLLERDARAGTAMSSIAKAHCAEAIFRVIDRAVQLCGGDGVSTGLPLAQYLNEVRPFRIYDGSTETHKWAIARRAAKSRQRAVANGAEFMGTATLAVRGAQ